MVNKYFAELVQRLNEDGISTGTPDGGKLPILLEGREIGSVVPGGGMRVRKESLDEPGANELYHRAGVIAAEVHEYMELMKNAPTLKAVSLSDSYKLLADFNGHVLGGMESERGVRFTTWQWTFDKAGLTLGHYFENDYAAAKKDFAVRAGLIQTDHLFTDEQLTDLYRSSELLLDEGPEPTPQQVEALTSARKQIEETVPDLRERLEAGTSAYGELVAGCFWELDYQLLKRRIAAVTRGKARLSCTGPEHRQRFEQWQRANGPRRPRCVRDQWLAALFLLTSSGKLWARTWSAISWDSIDFSKITLRDIDPQDYAVYQAAKSLCTGKLKITAGELPEREDLLAEKLEQIGVGLTLEKNCRVEKLEGDGGALQALVGTCVNADELQYLAKRMESFDTGELLRFRAAVAVEKPTDLKNLINLTFNLHCYTVITDFSDVAGIGRNHLLSKLTAISCDELAATDCEAIGRELIAGGGGTVTPYGVLYRNGNQPELVYNGRQFPEYFYRECEASLILSTDEDFKASETLYFPCFDVEIQKALLRLGVTGQEKCHAKLDAERICDAVRSLFEVEFTLTEHLDALNRLARCYMGFDEQTLEKYHSVFDYAWPQTPEEAVCLAENIFEFTALRDIHTAEQYGRYMIENSGHFDFDPNLEGYVDFQGYGQQRIQEENGVFTDRGYIAYHGTTPLVEEILSRNIPLEEQPEQGQQMGGI